MATNSEVRCSCEGYYGTIKYKGPVGQYEGDWLGIEWDIPDRGKHSGIHNGIQYFTCSVENSGSFVREKKVDYGMTFIQGIIQKYNTVTINELKSVILEGIPISSCGTPHDINIPNCEYIELSNTLLYSWYDLCCIVRSLPKLHSIVLRNNIMDKPFDHFNNSFSNITYLSVVQMNLTTEQLILILQIMNNIRQLCVANNSISTLKEVMFPDVIESIDLSNNNLINWSTDVYTSLKHLPNLNTLLLHGNQLNDIIINDDKCFPVLHTLSLSDNNIHNWSSINELSNIQSLSSLSVSGNPLLKGETVFVARQLVIAKIPQLKILHKSNINSLERNQAERDYIHKYMSQWLSTGSDKTSFNKEHPQYIKLISIHGLPDKQCITNTSTALKNRLISLTIQCNGQLSINKKLPDSLTVVKLKGMIQRLCNIDYTRQSLSYISTEGGMCIEINDDLKQLSFYSLENGDIIQVNEL